LWRAWVDGFRNRMECLLKSDREFGAYSNLFLNSWTWCTNLPQAISKI
jgi:hypothetical protein